MTGVVRARGMVPVKNRCGYFKEKTMKNNKMIAGVLAASLLAGCATIVGHPTQAVQITSTPDGASVVITDEKGVEVFKGSTPAMATLQKSDGSYWGGKKYTVVISKDGFKDQTIPMKASANGWYIGGNFILGGLIGWFVVDPLSGSMYTLSPEAIQTTMGEQTANNNSATDGNIRVVLLADVPALLRAQMVRVR
jgi:hypothetical protein